MGFAVRHRGRTSYHDALFCSPSSMRSAHRSSLRWTTLPRIVLMVTMLMATWWASQMQLQLYRGDPDLDALSSLLALQDGTTSDNLSNQQLGTEVNRRALGGNEEPSQHHSIVNLIVLKENSSRVSSDHSEKSSVAIVFTNVKNGSPFYAPYRIYPDYGGLKISDLDPADFQRRISKRDEARYEKERYKRFSNMNEYLSSTYLPDDELDYPQECERVAWRSSVFPTCNTVHEIDRVGENDEFLGSGYYRDTWLIQPSLQKIDTHFVLKQMRMPTGRKDKHHLPNARSFAKIQKEAIIMERLTASPRIVTAYGHCGLSILAEPMSQEVSPLIIPDTGYAKQSELDKLPDIQPANNLTALEKLDMALEMARSLADIHGHPGLIVHGDVHPVQWLFKNNRRQLKLNDFNNADILPWSRAKNDYCKIDRGAWGGMYRSPEEFEGDPCDEKIDVYSMGNNIYVLLTGYWPFYEDSAYSVVQDKVMNQTRPFVDDRYRSRSFIEGQMVEIMERLWEHEPEDRPSIFEVIAFLTNVRSQHLKMEKVKALKMLKTS